MSLLGHGKYITNIIRNCTSKVLYNKHGHLCFIAFCLILSASLHICMNTLYSTNGSSHDSYLRRDISDIASETSCLNLSMYTPSMDESKNEDSLDDKSNPFKLLRNIRVSNINRLIVGQLNINSIRNKFEALKSIVSGNLDILVVTESKLDNSFPDGQFLMEGYSPPFRLDRNANGGGILIYVREDITCRELKDHPSLNDLEGIFLELNIKKSKWLFVRWLQS